MGIKNMRIKVRDITENRTAVEKPITFYNYDIGQASIELDIIEADYLAKEKVKRMFGVLKIVGNSKLVTVEFMFKNNMWVLDLSKEILQLDNEIMMNVFCEFNDGTSLFVLAYGFKVRNDNSGKVFGKLKDFYIVSIDNIVREIREAVDKRKEQISRFTVNDFKGDKGEDGLTYEVEEKERELNEDERVGNEEVRILNEDSRKNGEIFRVGNEIDRMSNEESRELGEEIRIENEDVRKDNETNRVSSFGTYDGRITTLESDYAVMGTNLHVNSNDFTNVTGVNGSVVTIEKNISIPELSINDATRIKITGGTSITKSVIRLFNVKLGNIYYQSIFVKNNLDVPMMITGNAINTLNGNMGGKEVKKILFYGSNSVSPYVQIQLRPYTVDENLDVTVAKSILLDLTETFGAGNEPTANQMDRLLAQFPNSWFDGTKNIFIARWALNELRRLDNEKANVKQEPWQIPIFTNGALAVATAPLMYRKNSIGIGVFTGRFKPSTSGAANFQLPVGFKPATTVRTQVATNFTNMYATIVIGTTGQVYVEYPTNQIFDYLDFSQVTFQTE